MAGAPAASGAPAAGEAAPAPTRERLLGATLELLGEGGYAGTSVLAITERAGVAAGTLYRHFASREVLFVQLFREVCSREIEAMRAAAEDVPRPLDQLEAALLTFAGRALENPKLAWALLAEPVDALVDAERIEYRRRYRDLVATLLEAAIAEGQIPASDTEVLAAAIVGGVGEALVGPLAEQEPTGERHSQLLTTIGEFVRRAVGG